MAKTGYLVIIYQDINPSSPTYNQTKEERLQDETNCPYRGEANWIEDTKYCELTDNGMLTGYEITVYRDVEPLSSTYNQTREERELNLEECETDETTPNWQNIGEPFCRQKVYLPGGLMGNDGYMIQQQQDMNEYSETADEIRDVETLDLENCPLPNTEPVWQTISESCHLVTYNGQLVYDGTKDVIRVNTNQYSPSWNNNIPETANVEDEINCPSGIEKQYRWVAIEGGFSCVGYDKYEQLKKQESIDGVNWTDVVPLETMQGDLIERNSESCGYIEPQYRWTKDEIICIGYDKYSHSREQISYDGGNTWEDTGKTHETLIEKNSYECGYEPTVEYRWIVVEGQYECVGYDKHAVEKKQQSVDGGTTWTDVVPTETRTGSLIEHNSDDCGYVPETVYRWVTISDEYMCVGFDKHTMEKKQQSVDGGTTWTDVVPTETRTGSLIEANSADCGYLEPQYRWVAISDTFVCVGYDKHQQEKQQVSYDNGTTWEDVVPANTRTGSLIEHNSEDCGYVPPTPGDYENQYLTFEAIEDGTFTFTGTSSNSLSYSLDDGQTWTALRSGTASPTVTAGNKIMWKGTCTPGDTGSGKFSSNRTFNAYGNTMSIVHGDNFRNSTTISGYQFKNLFNSTKVVNSENLVLPATTLASECYWGMFLGCTSLKTAPVLPATTLANYCYHAMFRGCTNLTTVPVLPATTLANYCYDYMFESCKSLETAPELPATTLAIECYSCMFRYCKNLTTAPELPSTTLADGCYYDMFYNCTSLKTAPELPATTLIDNCYNEMFYGCSSLNYIKAMFTTTPGIDYTFNWVNGVASSGIFVKNSAATWNVTGTRGIPTGWTVVTE